TSRPQTLFKNSKYNAIGEATEFVLGYSLNSGVKTVNNYDTNGMGRLIQRQVTKVDGGSNVYSITGPSSGYISYAPNGSLLGITDGSDAAATNTYDDWNRLVSATKGSTNYSWDYDRYGNRLQQNGAGPSADANNRESS